MKQNLCYGLIVTICIIMCLEIPPVSATAGTMWTKSYYLSPGLGVMHEIQVDCGARLDLNSPVGGSYDLYALRNYDGPGTCKSNDYIMTHADKTAPAVLGKSTMSLEPGLWCIVVQARSGNGKYILNVARECTTPTPVKTPTNTPATTSTPTPAPTPTLTQTPCTSPYISHDSTGLLEQGQTQVYGYRIGGPRNSIEWILAGPCEPVIPGTLFSASQVSAFQKTFCGPDFDLYIYKDCDPRKKWCPAVYSDTKSSSNAYVTIPNPSSGSTYYALIYAKASGGFYTLTSRSYQCQDEGTITM